MEQIGHTENASTIGVAIATISESSSVRLGLALLMCGGCVAAYGKLSSLESSFHAELSTSYVTRELFTSEYSAQRRESELRYNVISAQLAAQSAELRSLMATAASAAAAASNAATAATAAASAAEATRVHLNDGK